MIISSAVNDNEDSRWLFSLNALIGVKDCRGHNCIIYIGGDIDYSEKQNENCYVSISKNNQEPLTARICANHNKIEKLIAEQWAKKHKMKITHGICKSCLERAQNELNKLKAQSKAKRKNYKL